MKIHRISLEAEAYARLAYIAALEQISPKDWIEQRINDAWGHRDEKAKNPIIQLDDKPKCGAVADSDKPKRKSLAKDQAAIEQIKELWKQSPRPTKAGIARTIGYPATTTSEMIGRMLKKGELVD